MSSIGVRLSGPIHKVEQVLEKIQIFVFIVVLCVNIRFGVVPVNMRVCLLFEVIK